MKIQIIDIISDDMEDGSDATKKNIVITVYGKTECDKSIICSFSGLNLTFI